MDLKQIAYYVLGAGVLLLIIGGVLLLAARLNLPLGRLPGDIHAEGKNWSFNFPVVTCLILSVVLTLLVNLFFRNK